MSGDGEVSSVVACTAAITSIYESASQILQNIRISRAEKDAPPPSRLLEESVECAPQDIRRENERGFSRYGDAFKQGDQAALSALQGVLDGLRCDLVQNLEDAAQHGEQTDLTLLVDVADCARDQVIDTLIQLRQRLLAEEITGSAASPTSQPSSSQLQSKQERRQSHQTWSWDRSLTAGFPSRDASGEEDTSGAENGHHHHHHHRRRGGTLLAFLKHHRAHSYGDRHGDHHAASNTEDAKKNPQQISPLSIIPSLRIEPTNASSTSFDLFDRPGQHRPPRKHGDLVGRSTETVSGADEQPVDQQGESRTFSEATVRARNSSNAATIARTMSFAVPTPSHENNYLGYCKGAIRLQNGDKKALERRKEFNDGWSQAAVHYLACSSHKCAFAGHIDINIIMNKVWLVDHRGLKFRWPFLAKSHVTQQKVKDHAYVYQCSFCVFSGEQSPVFHGTDFYLEHISSHRGQIREVVLYKTKCINDRICGDDEDFDINLFPLSMNEMSERRASEMLTNDFKSLMKQSGEPEPTDSVLNMNENWNEGLSDFHYKDDFDRSASG